MDEKKTDLEHFPTSASAMRMLSYVSGHFYDNSYIGKWIYQVIGQEYDKAWDVIAGELAEQMFIETATWGLMYHEIKWGLPVRPNLSYEERRGLIYQKRDYRAPMIPYRMEKYLENATGFEVHIADIHDPGEYGFVPLHPNVFKAYFLGEETLDSKLVFEIINRLKQSHTTYTVNDRMEIRTDNKDIESIVLMNIMFYLSSGTDENIRCCTDCKSGIHNTEYETITAGMETKSKDCWYLDGTCRLDGTKLLNSVHKKEVLE